MGEAADGDSQSAEAWFPNWWLCSYSLELRAGEFWVKKGNIFLAAADSGLIGIIAPKDEEFTVVNADPPPTTQGQRK